MRRRSETPKAVRGAARVAVVALAFGFGALFAFGSVIAALLEGDGFTSRAADGRRFGYLGLLAVGLTVSVLVPFRVAGVAFPQSRRRLIPVALVVLAVALAAFVAAAR